jgi:hypothetical protein
MNHQHLCIAVITCVVASIAWATPIEVGTGVNEARVYIEWSDGFSVEFLVRFGQSEADMTTGLGLIDVIEAETELTTERQDFGFGQFVDSISYQQHSNAGFGGGDLWWHYWENDTGSRTGWTGSMVGALGRVVAHGHADAWVYGHSDVPAPQWEAPFLSGYGQYAYDANDFATAWIDYQPNGMVNDWLSGQPLDDPTAALGRPAVDTTGDDWFIPMDTPAPVVPVYPAFRSTEVVYLGEGGSLTLAFNHPVSDDENNPYGIDFIVFGNAAQAFGGEQSWVNGDPAGVQVEGSGGSEPGIVSVSQDGTTWYSYTSDPNFMADSPDFIKLAGGDEDGPFCDGFAPTLGRVYDPCYADASLGAWNQFWAEPTNPTLPLDPALSYASLGGMSVARMAQTYGDSAGGTGYDLARLDLPADPNTGKKWFQFVRIDDAPGGGTTDIDAVSDVSCPGDYRHPAPLGDVNGDFCVDVEDAAVVADFWGLEITDPAEPAAVADLNGDGNVDIADLDIVLENLGVCTWTRQ